ncbi:MAG: fibronectin type III domain-containing protein [Brevundimonas sp.]
MRNGRLTAMATSVALAVGLVSAVGLSPAAATIATEAEPATSSVIGSDVQLQWQRVPGATGYLVQVATSTAFDSATLVETATTRALRWVPSTRMWGSAGDQTLYWRVVPQGVSAAPDDAVVHTFGREMAPAPEGLEPADGATVSYPTPVALSWEAVRGAASYTVRLTGGYSVTATVAGTAFTPDRALPAGTYTWSVQPNFATSAVPVSMPGTPSAPRTFTVAWPADASRPGLLAPADHAVANDLEFRWTAVDGAKAYQVDLSSSPDFTTFALRSTVTGTVFVPTGIVVNGSYYWRVTPLDVNDQPGEPSATWQVSKRMSMSTESVLDSNGQTAQPYFTNITTDAVTPTVLPFSTFHLSWTAVPRTTYYQVTVTRQNGPYSPMTCKTASTSATIVAASGLTGNNPGALSGSGTCLWSASAPERIQAGIGADDTSGLYSAKVVAVNVPAAKTTDFQLSNPTDADVQPSTTSSNHFFRIGGEERTATLGYVSVDPIAGADQSWPIQRTADASPLLTWQPVTAADGYIVQLFSDADRSTQIAELRTTTPSVRAPGVFAANDTSVTNDAYVAEIIPAKLSGNTWSEISNFSHGYISWQRTADVPTPGVVSDGGGTPLLSMTSTPADALGGGNRGYRVLVYNKNAALPSWTLLVDQPSTVAAQKFTISTTDHTMVATPLKQGDYEFAWAVLDSAGKSGPTSARRPFSIGRTTPSGLAHDIEPDGTSATLRWGNDVSAARYTVSLRDTAGGSVAPIPDTTGRSVTVQGLVPGKTYAWSVCAKDSAGNATYFSSEDSFSIPQGDVVVTSGTLSATSSALPTITWNPLAGASRYLVRVATATQGLAAVAAVETSALRYVPTVPLVYGTQYVYDVRAVPAVRTTTPTRPILGSSPTNSLSVITTPGAPSITKAEIAGTGLNFVWTALTGAAAGSSAAPTYVVRYRPKADLTAPWVYANVTGTTLTTPPLLRGTAYDAAVAAVNSEGQGPWSAVRSATTAGVPSAPGGLRATSALKSLKVSWSSASSALPVTSYAIRWKPTSSSTWTTRALAAADRSYTITGLGQGTYRVEVWATSAAGAGLPATIDQSSLGLASAPRSLVAKRGDRSATLTWSPPTSTGGSPVSSYLVERRQYSSATSTWSAWSRVSSSTAATRTVTVTGMTNGSKYALRVSAITAVGPGTASSVVYVTPAGKPLAPAIIVAVSKGKAKITWHKVNGNGSPVTSYKVQRSSDGKVWTTLKTGTPSTVSYTWTGAKKGKAYYVRVVAYNAIGSSPSAKVKFTAK